MITGGGIEKKNTLHNSTTFVINETTYILKAKAHMYRPMLKVAGALHKALSLLENPNCGQPV